MVCTPFKTPDGIVGIMCGPRKKPKRCAWCSRPSTKLCDHPKSAKKTCDAPMCDRHAKNVGPDRDLCPDHVNSPQGALAF